MSAREVILAKVRAGLDAKADDPARRKVVAGHMSERRRHLVPARVAGQSPAVLNDVLRKWLEMAAGQLIEVPGPSDVPAAIADYLRRHNLPQSVRMGDDAYLAALPWRQVPALQITRGRPEPGDEVGITHALAAVAETGTLVVPSGPANPVTLSFLPATNIIVVERSNIVGPYEDAWNKVRATYGDTIMPRTLNLISGPSRSADIGGIPVLGAHGPMRLCVIVVG